MAMLTTAGSLGAALGSIGALLEFDAIASDVRYLALAGLALAWASHELGLVRLPMPHRHAQVPESWRRTRGPVVGMTAYGALLGVGLLTFVDHAGLYVVLPSAALSASPLFGALLLGSYATGRALSIGGETLLAVRWIDWYPSRFRWLEPQLGRIQATALVVGALILASSVLVSIAG